MTVTKLKIRFYGDPCLRKKSLLVNEVGPGERLLIQSMVETMYEHKGVGLAAAQVGINKRIFVADVGQGAEFFINPRIIKKSGSDVMEEGCLSIPNVSVPVKRAKKVWVKYVDAENREHERAFDNLLARVVQHELDHLDGKLIVDYAKKGLLKDIKAQLNTLSAQSQVLL